MKTAFAFAFHRSISERYWSIEKPSVKPRLVTPGYQRRVSRRAEVKCCTSSSSISSPLRAEQVDAERLGVLRGEQPGVAAERAVDDVEGGEHLGRRLALHEWIEVPAGGEPSQRPAHGEAGPEAPALGDHVVLDAHARSSTPAHPDLTRCERSWAIDP